MTRKKISHPKRQKVWFKGAIIWFNANLLNGRGVHLVHAGPKGALLTKDQVNWRNINGILIRTQNSQTFLHFRRRPRYM